MPSYETLKLKQTHLVRKALDGSVFSGNISVPAITTLTGPTSALLALPTGMSDLGILTTDGAQFGRDVSTSDITGWTYTSPVRSDVVTDTSTIQVECQETKAKTIGMATGFDLSAVVPALGGEVSINKPSRPSSKFYRVLALAVDQGDQGDIYIGRYFPRAKPTAFAAQAFGGGDNAITWGVTMTGYEDATLGYSERWLFGGPGWAALLADMGFLPAATT